MNMGLNVLDRGLGAKEEFDELSRGMFLVLEPFREGFVTQVGEASNVASNKGVELSARDVLEELSRDGVASGVVGRWNPNATARPRFQPRRREDLGCLPVRREVLLAGVFILEVLELGLGNPVTRSHVTSFSRIH